MYPAYLLLLSAWAAVSPVCALKSLTHLVPSARCVVTSLQHECGSVDRRRKRGITGSLLLLLLHAQCVELT